MTAVQFCYWLQGYFEIAHHGLEALSVKVDQGITSDRVKVIKNHLNMVFAHDLDPVAGGPEVQKKLNDIHDPNVKVRC